MNDDIVSYPAYYMYLSYILEYLSRSTGTADKTQVIPGSGRWWSVTTPEG